MDPRILPTAFDTYVTETIDSTLTPRLVFACPCTIYAYTHPCLLSALIVLHLIFIHHHPPSQNRKSSRNHFRSHRQPTRPSHHPRREALHQYLYIHLNKSTSSKPIIFRHVFRSQIQIRNGNHYPIISCPKPTLQPRNERLLEMLQMPTHQQSSGVITLLRQLPTCER